ncbi:MAG: hypothetical protein ACJAXJ_001370 [Colwellia sp.]
MLKSASSSGAGISWLKGVHMLKTIHIMVILFFCIMLCACSTFNTDKNINGGSAQWDFDHSVQFRQTKLSTNHYQLEIIPNNKVNFERLAVFLLRKSHEICGSYRYKVEIIRGVEDFDDKRVMPNYITPSLIAKLECA